jgi:hypothetical protein
MTSPKPSKNGKKSAVDTRFQAGNPGGPGRPVGSRNAATIALDKMADNAGKAILKKMVEAAKSGDMTAAAQVLSRIWPIRKGRPISLELPKIDTAADLVAGLGRVADAVAAGDITPDEGQAVSAVLETKRRAIETLELETRIVALEKERIK